MSERVSELVGWLISSLVRSFVRKLGRNERTCISASTVTQGTHRSLRQLIHVESSTVTDPDVILPVTTFTDPVITNLSANHALGLCGMFTVEPARGMGTTSPCWYAGVWHDFTGGGREAVPLGG